MRIAVLGQGSIGRRHAANALALGHEVVAWDPIASLLDGTEHAATAEAALTAAEVAIVASPSSEHAAQARLALERGCHTLVEKPLALSAAHVAPLEELARAGGLTLGVAMNLRFHPGVLALRDALSSGTLGDVLVARAWFGSWLPGWRPGTDYRSTYSAQRALGGGVLLDAIHEIDYLTWLLGEVRGVTATLATVSDLELDVEDVAQLQLEFSSGTQATLSLDYLDREYDRGCRLIGSEATAGWSWAGEETHVTGADGVRVTTATPATAAPTYEAELAAFLAAVAAGTPPATSAAEARHALGVVEAARESAATGTRAAPRW